MLLNIKCNQNEQQQNAKIMLNYEPHGRRRLGRPWKRLLDESETGLSRPNAKRMMMPMNINSVFIFATTSI